MRLTLNVLRCPEAAVPESRTSAGNDIAIGRGLDCDWVLQDPDRVLSKRHCVLEFRGGYWQVRDTSTNGTFLNNAAEPIGRDLVAPLSDGDRLRFGNYELEVRIAAEAGAGWGAAPAWGEAAIGSAGGPGRPAADPFGDPFAPPPGLGAGPLPGSAGGIPADWDPFADNAAPMPDHTPSAADAFVPPRAVPLPPGGAGGIPADWDPFADSPPAAPPGGGMAGIGAPPPVPSAGATGAGGLPADWDPLADLAEPAAPPVPRPVAPPPVPRAAPPIAPVAPPAQDLPPFALPEAEATPSPFAAVPPVAEPPFAAAPSPVATEIPPPVAPPPEALGDPFAEEGVPSRSIPYPADLAALPGKVVAVAPQVTAPPLPVAPPVTPAAAPPIMAAATPVAPPVMSAATPVALPVMPVAPVAAPAAAGAEMAAAMAALLRGAGIPLNALHGAAAENPLAVFEHAGAALRGAVAGLRALLIARADVKREFRIEQTMLRAVGNNPVKFAATDEAAVAALIAGVGHGTRALAETVNDLTAHEVATLAATQAAARALLDRLAPGVVEEADSGGGGLFGSKEKRLWEAYRKLHTKVTEQFEDDFDSVFGKEFARAYEQAVASKGDEGESFR